MVSSRAKDSPGARAKALADLRIRGRLRDKITWMHLQVRLHKNQRL